MVIQHNLPYMTANRHYNNNVRQMTQASLRLSSGMRINSAADDPAGMAISQKMKAQIRGLDVAQKLQNDILGYYRTADAALDGIGKILQRMYELTVQSANGTNTDDDRIALELEYKQLIQELDDTAYGATFNGEKIFGGGFVKDIQAQSLENIQTSGLEELNGLLIQVGANEGDLLAVDLENVSSESLLVQHTSIGTQEGAQGAIEKLKSAISSVALQRSLIGANIRRIEHKLEYTALFADNLREAESRITDADMAKEIVNFTKYKLLADVGTSIMLHEKLRQETVLHLMDFTYANRSVM